MKEKMDGGELNDEDFLVEEYESEEEGGLGCAKFKRKAGGVSVSSSSDDDDEEEDDGFDEEDEEEAPLKIYFCSRTHSQLMKFIKELRKTVFPSQLNNSEKKKARASASVLQIQERESQGKTAFLPVQVEILSEHNSGNIPLRMGLPQHMLRV
ncbi:RAD3-like DNA-binding helicase protein [Actinidia rufa]|uniref:RAD3-like DNA-binding helicase protein n=1 Tax=Actinidia rufa TaxID=165716 RepID=A0A7J0F7L5_9ERIC|nr:RAD3-like DNA-binding helicase protein [Actinidia rufa]